MQRKQEGHRFSLSRNTKSASFLLFSILKLQLRDSVFERNDMGTGIIDMKAGNRCMENRAIKKRLRFGKRYRYSVVMFISGY